MTDPGGAGKPRYLGPYGGAPSIWSTKENIAFNKRDDEALELAITGLRDLEADWGNTHDRSSHHQHEQVEGKSTTNNTEPFLDNNSIATQTNDDALLSLGSPGLRAIFADLAAGKQHDYHQPQWGTRPSTAPQYSQMSKAPPHKQETYERPNGNGALVVAPKPRYPHPPPIVSNVGKENVRPVQLVSLSTKALFKGQQKKPPQQPWRRHDPVWNPTNDPIHTGKLVPSPSKVIKAPPGYYLLPRPSDNNFENNKSDEVEEEDEEVSISQKTSAMATGSILRVVSYDEDDLHSTRRLRSDEQLLVETLDRIEIAKKNQTEDNSDEGVAKKQEVSPEEEEQRALILDAPRMLPAPRRLNYAKAVISNLESMAIYDIIPTLKELPTTCNDYANLIGNILEEALPDDTSRAVAAAQAECVLRHMRTEYKNGQSTIRPDGGMYNKVMHGYAILGNPEKVEELLRAMYEEYQLGDELAEPNVKHYTTLLHAWQKANVVDAPVHCEKILKEMHELHDSGSLSKCKPDTYTYTSVLHCWADSTRDDAAIRAEALFREMKDRFEGGDEGLRPDDIAYSNLINAITNSNGFSRAEDILWEMVDDFLKGNPRCKPRIRNLNTILAVWSKSTAPFAPERAEYLVRRWLRITNTTVLDVKPDNYSYCLVLKSWAISSRKDVPDRTMQAITWMKELAENGEDAARLDHVKIGTCMTAWINARSFRHAADFLEKTCNECIAGEHKIVPEYQYFNKTTRALCSVNNVQRADELVRLIWKLKILKVRFPQDTLALVRFVIFEWIRLESPNRAEDLLLTMEALYRRGKIKEYPDGHTYQLVIAAWNKSKFHDKKDHVRELKERLKHNTNRMTQQQQPFKFFRKTAG